MLPYKNPVEKFNIITVIFLFILMFVGSIDISIAESASVDNKVIGLSVKYNSILSSSESGKIGRLGGTAIGDISSDVDVQALSDITPPDSVANLVNISYAQDYINWTWSDPEDIDFDHMEVYIYGNFITSVLKGIQFYNAANLLPDTEYAIAIRTVDTSGNMNATWVNHTITTAPLADTTLPASVTNLTNISYADDHINWTWTDPTDADFNHSEVYLDGTFQTNATKGVQFYNATGLTPATAYTIATRTVDASGNTNATWVNHTATTAPLADTTLPASISNLTNVSYAGDYINWTWNDPDDVDFSHVEIYIDSNFITSVLKGIQFYNVANLLPDTEYTIATRTVDTSGYINQTWVNHTARTAPNKVIDLSVEYNSKILSSSESGKIGHLGGTAIGDINGDGVNDLIVSSYEEDVTRYSLVNQPLDKDSWTESSNLSLWHAYNGIQSISVSPYRISGKNSIIGVRNSSKEGTFYISWNESLNLTGVQSLKMYINVSGRKENLTKITIYSENNRSLLYDAVNSLDKGNWTEIIINFTKFRKVGPYNSSNITAMALGFSGGYKNDKIKIDNLHFVTNQTISSGGAVYIFYGPVHGIYNTSDANVKIVGTETSFDFGEYITVGDVNKDSYKDVIVGSPGTSDYDGKVQVFFGGSQLDAIIFKDNYSIYGKHQSKLGVNIISKDINNDFMDDLIIGAPNTSKVGEIYVIYGSGELQCCIDMNYSNSNITFVGKDIFDNIGRQRTFDIGDIYGDGQKDLVIGTQFGDGEANTKQNAGEIYIINNISSNNGIIKLNEENVTTMIYGTDAGDSLGTQVIVSDFNSDRLDDILVGAAGADGADNNREGAGEVYMIYGRHDLINFKNLSLNNADVRIIGADPGDALGNVIGTGNASSILIGSKKGDCLYNNKDDCGDGYILYNIKDTYGLLDLTTFQPNITIYGPEQDDNMRDMYTGDVSGDDIPDFIIGFREAHDLNGYETGNVFVINGRNELAI